MNDIEISISKLLEPKIESAIDSDNIEQFIQDVLLMINQEHLTNTKMGDTILTSLQSILKEKHPSHAHLIDKYIILI